MAAPVENFESTRRSFIREGLRPLIRIFASYVNIRVVDCEKALDLLVETYIKMFGLTFQQYVVVRENEALISDCSDEFVLHEGFASTAKDLFCVLLGEFPELEDEATEAIADIVAPVVEGIVKMDSEFTSFQDYMKQIKKSKKLFELHLFCTAVSNVVDVSGFKSIKKSVSNVLNHLGNDIIWVSYHRDKVIVKAEAVDRFLMAMSAIEGVEIYDLNTPDADAADAADVADD